jgi:hypothetical protein
MVYPLIDKSLIPYLRLAHGSYSLLVMLLFFYQGWLGIAIRRARRAGGPLPFSAIKRHRKAGRLFAALGVAGFLSGLTLILLRTGNALEYAIHFLVGCALVLSILAAIQSSRRIMGRDSSGRNAHTAAGIVVLLLYGINSLIGISILF